MRKTTTRVLPPGRHYLHLVPLGGAGAPAATLVYQSQGDGASETPGDEGWIGH